MRYIALLALLLTGCAELGARAVTSSLEAVDAAKDFVDEKTDRREALRLRLYALQDRVWDCYTAQTMISAESAPDCSAQEAAYTQAKGFYDEIYPDAESLYSELGKIRDARQEFLEGY